MIQLLLLKSMGKMPDERERYIGSGFLEFPEKYWMDDVVCEGDESSITQCKFTGWGSSDCDVTEAAGVACVNRTSILNPKKESLGLRLQEVLDVRNTRLRLAGGRHRNEGRVEVKTAFKNH